MATYSEIVNKLKANTLDEDFSLYNQGSVDWASMGHGRAEQLKEGFCHGTCMDWARGLILGTDAKKNARISDDSKYNNLVRGHSQLLFYMTTKTESAKNLEQQQALIDRQKQIIAEQKEIELKSNSLTTAWNKQDAQRTLLFNNYVAANNQYSTKANDYNKYVNLGKPVPPHVAKACDDAEAFKNIQHQVYLDFNNRLTGKQTAVQSTLDGLQSQITTGTQQVSALSQKVNELKNRDMAPSTWKAFAVAMDEHMDKIADKYAALEGKRKKRKRFSGLELKAHQDDTQFSNLPTFANVLNSSEFRPKTCMIIGFRFATVKSGTPPGEGGHAIAFYKDTTTEGYFLEPNFGSFKVAVAKMPALMAYVIGPQAYGALAPEAWVWNNTGSWELLIRDITQTIASKPTVQLKPVTPIVPKVIKPPPVQEPQVNVGQKPFIQTNVGQKPTVQPNLVGQTTGPTTASGPVKWCKKCDTRHPFSTKGWVCPTKGCGGGLVKL